MNIEDLMKPLPFRIGTTSYIIPADILPNARYLAGKVDDIELVLFEVDDGSNNLPHEDVLRELRVIAGQHDLTYTVHLPLDLQLGEGKALKDQSIRKALRVIEHTAPLQPFAYVLHLDGRKVRTQYGSRGWQDWKRHTKAALQELVALLDDSELLAVENLDRYPPQFWDEVLDGMPVSRCIDVGHLWLDGHDPLAFLEEHIRRTRVLHLHGIAERDHKSLAHVAPEELERVVCFLIDSGFQGVFTMEIFGEDDFHTSSDSLLEIVHRLGWEAAWERN